MLLIIKICNKYFLHSVRKIVKEINRSVFIEQYQKTNRSFLNSYKNVLISISITWLITGCGSNNKTNSAKTKVSRSEVNIESLKSGYWEREEIIIRVLNIQLNTSNARNLSQIFKLWNWEMRRERQSQFAFSVYCRRVKDRESLARPIDYLNVGKITDLY